MFTEIDPEDVDVGVDVPTQKVPIHPRTSHEYLADVMQPAKKPNIRKIYIGNLKYP
jgi:hypothetical protein